VQTWSAEHDGYEQGADPAVHRRTASLNVGARTLTVDDLVKADGPITVRLAWHLGPSVGLQLLGTRATLRWVKDGTTHSAAMSLPEDLSWTVHRSESNPVVGWYSASFGHKEPATTLLGVGRVPVGSLTTRITFDAG
jgi:hypothetical protein